MSEAPLTPTKAGAELPLSVRALSKSYGETLAVSNLDFSVERGEVVGFLGANGAGKTTTFRMLAGTLGPSSGEVRLFGEPLAGAPVELKKKIGYLPENASLYPEMTALEYLRFRGSLLGGRGERLRGAVEKAIDETGVRSHAKVVIAQLSKGYRQRVALASALLFDPPLLLLDEPTAGLDPTQVFEVRHLIRSLAKDRSVLLSTHILAEVEAVCDRVLILARGQLAFAGSLEALRATDGLRGFRWLLRRSTPEARELIVTKGWKLLSESERPEATEWIVAPMTGAVAPEELTRELVLGGIPILESGPVKAPLEELFLSLLKNREPGE